MDSFLTRSAKKLEQALGVPRPWELTPATSIGYQMATGEGSIGERARKGTAQFLGRYATNIKEPWGYEAPENVLSYQTLKSVLQDKPPESWVGRDREVLYREMFDLPARNEPMDIEKVGEKQYRLKDPSFGWEVPSGFSGGAAQHSIMGGVYVQPESSGGYRYSDVWDIVSSDEEGGSSSPTAKIRNLIAPILRPATIGGEFPSNLKENKKARLPKKPR